MYIMHLLLLSILYCTASCAPAIAAAVYGHIRLCAVSSHIFYAHTHTAAAAAAIRLCKTQMSYSAATIATPAVTAAT
jgi:hypothetical protein